MRKALLFAEDEGHERVVTRFIHRVAQAEGVTLKVEVRSATGGAGRATSELQRFLRDLDRTSRPGVDLLVVARDSNCVGMATRRRELKRIVAPREAVLAVPNPHVERWLLLDSQAFKQVLGQGCSAPDEKCHKGRYKSLLREAVRATGREPLVDGLEFAEDIIDAMSLPRSERADSSLAHFLRDLRAVFHRWKGEECHVH